MLQRNGIWELCKFSFFIVFVISTMLEVPQAARCMALFIQNGDSNLFLLHI